MATETITLGGGCFWCTEAVFVKVQGVTDVESGYSNGHVQRPSYEQVCTGTTGHNEVVKLEYDPAQIGVRDILAIFFLIHDPTTLNRQGPDEGDQYRSAIFTFSPAQEAAARAGAAQAQAALKQKVVTQVAPIGAFYKAEGYHQQYAEKTGHHGCAVPGVVEGI